MAVTNPRRINILKELKSSGMPEDLYKNFEAALDDNSPAAEKVTTQFLAQSDYSREMNKQAEAEKARQQEHLALKTEIATTRDNLNRWAKETANEYMQKEAKLVTSAKRQVERLANAKKLAQSETGLPLAELEPDSTLMEFAALPITVIEPGKLGNPTAFNQPAQPAQPPQQFNNQQVPMNQPNQQINNQPNNQLDPAEAGAYLARQLAQLVDLPAQHRALFGTELDVSTLVDESIRLGKDPKAHWEETFNVNEVKQQKTKEQWLNEEKVKWEAEMAAKLNLSPGSNSFGDFSKLANSMSNPALQFTGEGNDAMSLDSAFRAKMQREGRGPSNNQPNPNQPNPNQPNPILSGMSDEAIGQEFFSNLAAHEK